MSSVWEQVTSSDHTPRGSFEGGRNTNMNSKEGSGTQGAPAPSTSPQHGSALQQRKDDHAHRKRNRIVVLMSQSEIDIALLRAMSTKKTEVR
jgi:hypothetical protein